MIRVHVLVILAWVWSTPLSAGTRDSVYADSDGVALLGYDVVAYHVQDSAVMGDSGISHEWNGVTWHFVSKENRDRFAAHPERYAPAYGGYCAYGVRWGRKVKTDPRQYTVLDSTLYINLNADIRKRWEKHPHWFIRVADRKWERTADDEAK